MDPQARLMRSWGGRRWRRGISCWHLAGTRVGVFVGAIARLRLAAHSMAAPLTRQFLPG